MKISKSYFESLKRFAFAGINEHLTLKLQAETSQFIRINDAKIRQSGIVEDASLEFLMVIGNKPRELKKSTLTTTITGNLEEDQTRIRWALETLRSEITQLPFDPYAEIPNDTGTSILERKGKLLPHGEAVHVLLSAIKGLNITGIYASGNMIRAMASTAGTEHYFETENFSFDYSVFTPEQRALKGTFAGTEWKASDFEKEMNRVRDQLPALSKTSLKPAPGAYRTYLAPAALESLIAMFSWGTIGEGYIQKEESSLVKIRSGEKSFSPLFSMSEDFRSGSTPRFGGEGKLPPEFLPLIMNGKLLNTLINQRTEMEYKVPANGASGGESLRAVSVAGGSLKEEGILAQLGTGLYISNLWYLNWSDQRGGMITGMTRYACFWVENGKIVAPIENLRFDDTLFNLFGSSVEAFTNNPIFLPETGTYESRQPGGASITGLLLSAMKFTQ